MASFTVVAAKDLKAEEERTHQVRCLSTELGCLTRQDGSASLSQGDTSTICVTYGPAEVRIVRELIDKATVEVLYKPKIGLPRPMERKWERVIRNTLESAITTNLHPRSAITIIVQEIEDVGSKLACVINTACLALLDAAVNMNYMVAAVTACVSDSGQVYVDPAKKTEEECRACMTLVFNSSKFSVNTVVTSGIFCYEEYQKCVSLTREAAKSIFKFYRDSLSKKLLKST